MNKLTTITLAALLLGPLTALHAVDNDGVPATVGGPAGSPKAEANRVAEISLIPVLERFPSPVPHQVFSETLAEQEKELKTNALMLRFAESRKKLAADRYRPAYHFVSPESQLNDPNGLCFWQGRWHLFYQAYPPDEFPNPADIPKRRQHWGHAVSDDLVHWRDLPYAIYPGIERMCFSGSTVVEENRVVAFYPGIDAGQMVAVSKDPLLLELGEDRGKTREEPRGGFVHLEGRGHLFRPGGRRPPGFIKEPG